jgi:hypothetical protein
VKHGSSSGDVSRYAAGALVCILDISEKLYRELATEISNADNTLAAKCQVSQFQTWQHRLVHLEEEGKVKEVDSGSQKWKRYDYLLQNECFLHRGVGGHLATNLAGRGSCITT